MTMDAKHLDRAKKIVEGIEWCRDALSYEQPHPTGSMTLSLIKERKGSTQPVLTNFQMSRAIREQAFRMWRREVELKEASLRREAAQIGLKLEDSANG